MRYLLIIFAIVNSITLHSCSMNAMFPFRIESDYDEFNQTYSVHTINNYVIVTSKYHTQDNVEFNMTKFTYKDVSDYSILISFFANDWLFIEPELPLVLLIDGKRYEFESKSSKARRTVLKHGSVIEHSYYKITPDQIKMLLSAKEVKFRISGKYPLDCAFSNETFLHIKEFYEKYVDDIFIQLKNGQLLSGKLSNKVENEWIIIKKGDGNIEKIEWKDIQQIIDYNK